MPHTVFVKSAQKSPQQFLESFCHGRWSEAVLLYKKGILDKSSMAVLRDYREREVSSCIDLAMSEIQNSSIKFLNDLNLGSAFTPLRHESQGSNTKTSDLDVSLFGTDSEICAIKVEEIFKQRHDGKDMGTMFEAFVFPQTFLPDSYECTSLGLNIPRSVMEQLDNRIRYRDEHNQLLIALSRARDFMGKERWKRLKDYPNASTRMQDKYNMAEVMYFNRINKINEGISFAKSIPLPPHSHLTLVSEEFYLSQSEEDRELSRQQIRTWILHNIIKEKSKFMYLYSLFQKLGPDSPKTHWQKELLLDAMGKHLVQIHALDSDYLLNIPESYATKGSLLDIVANMQGASSIHTLTVSPSLNALRSPPSPSSSESSIGGRRKLSLNHSQLITSFIEQTAYVLRQIDRAKGGQVDVSFENMNEYDLLKICKYLYRTTHGLKHYCKLTGMRNPLTKNQMNQIKLSEVIRKNIDDIPDKKGIKRKALEAIRTLLPLECGNTLLSLENCLMHTLSDTLAHFDLQTSPVQRRSSLPCPSPLASPKKPMPLPPRRYLVACGVGGLEPS